MPAPGPVKGKKPLHELVTVEVSRMKRKPFIEHYRAKYHDPLLSPSWAISECLSFGPYSRCASWPGCDYSGHSLDPANKVPII